MISLKQNYTALLNLKSTIDALENFDNLIKYYSEDKPGPAYLAVKYHSKVDDIHMLVALNAQRQTLVEYLATLGIDANN